MDISIIFLIICCIVAFLDRLNKNHNSIILKALQFIFAILGLAIMLFMFCI